MFGYGCDSYPNIQSELRANCPVACGYGCPDGTTNGSEEPVATTASVSTTTPAPTTTPAQTAPPMAKPTATMPESTTTPAATSAAATTPPAATTTQSLMPCEDDHKWVDPLFGSKCSQWAVMVRMGFDCEAYHVIRDVLPKKCPVACKACAEDGLPPSDPVPAPAPTPGQSPSPAGGEDGAGEDKGSNDVPPGDVTPGYAPAPARWGGPGNWWRRTVCHDDGKFRDPKYAGSCPDWAGWVARGDGFRCNDYPSISAALNSACPRACGLCGR